MGTELIARRSPAARRPAGTVPRGRVGTAEATGAAAGILRLQRLAGNKAVALLLERTARSAGPACPRTLQREVRGHREHPPVTTLQPAGTLSQEQWTAAYRAATAKPSVEAYQPLFRDIALTAGMAALGPGFVPSTVPSSDGKTAAPGLNMTLNTSDEPGHTGWVDRSGTFGVPLEVGRGPAAELSVAIVLSPRAVNPDKALSLRTVRHEMVHARHKMKVLEAVKAWRSTRGRRPDFDSWLRQQAKRKVDPMTALDVALISRGARNGAANTEVLAYVEGFTTDFHRRPATAAQAGPAFVELLGAVETRKLYTWAQADPAVQAEALTRLREYQATLDIDHQRLWKQWLDQQLARAANDKTGRKDFLSRLTTFVT